MFLISIVRAEIVFSSKSAKIALALSSGVLLNLNTLALGLASNTFANYA
jgi:hypothetical protein